MKIFCRTALTFVFALFLAMALEPRAYAYVDPGAGLLAYQTLSALAAGAVFHFRRRIRRLLGALR